MKKTRFFHNHGIISGYISARGVAWGELAASATLMIIPVLLFAAFMQKYMKKGILTGSIK